MQSIELETQRLTALRGIASGVLRLKWLRDATRFEIAAQRHGLALKYGYNPAQPRVPRGNPDGGEWTDAGGGSGQGGGAGGDKPQTRDSRATGRIRLADEIPTGDSPEIPKKRPPKSKDRTKAKKDAARLLGQLTTTAEVAAAMAKFGAWLRTYSPEIESYRDPPRSLEELQRGASTPKLGYDIHHIVEQTQAERDGFARDVIDSPDNLVRVPRLRHQEINGWYQTKNKNFGGESPRVYLQGRSWAVRRAVGLEALQIHKVLER